MRHVTAIVPRRARNLARLVLVGVVSAEALNSRTHGSNEPAEEVPTSADCLLSFPAPPAAP